MLPVLFSVGSVTVYSFGFLLAIGFFLASFIIWRRFRELGLKEEKTIDFLLSLGFWGLVLARVIYILANFKKFGFNIASWLLLGRYPGLSLWGGMLGFFLVLLSFSRKEKWEFWRLADEVSFGILPFLIFSQIGCFFDGCILGKPTEMFWGVYFPGSLLRRQPVSLLAFLALLMIWFFVLWLERRWRLWEWYQSQADGFISLTFVGLFLVTNFVLAFWRDSKLYFYWLEIVLSFLGLALTLGLFYYRSGRQLSEDLAFLAKRRNNEKEKKENQKKN